MFSLTKLQIRRNVLPTARYLMVGSIKYDQHSHINEALSTPSVSTVKDKYDVIIAGGGMVGCTLACCFGKNPLLKSLKVLLLEGSPKQKFNLNSEYSNRVVALNQNTKKLMKSLQVWNHVESMRLQPVRKMQVWDACSDAMITFDSSDVDNEDVAYIVENDVLLHAVNLELNSAYVDNVQIVYGAKIKDYELTPLSSPNENFVTLENEDVYSCKLLIGADGANSKVRQAMGSQCLSWNYDQMAVVATLELAEECENSTAWQRFLPGGGVVALLPLNPRLSSLVWSTETHHAKQLLQLSNEQFVDALNDAIWRTYSKGAGMERGMSWVRNALAGVGLPDGAARQLPPSVRAAASRAAFPLGFGHSVRYVSNQVALVGDAAHRVHPLAGQGVNLGFGDVRDLTELLADTLYSAQPITSEAWLREYETRRQRHNVPTQLAIDALHRVYGAELLPLVLLRSASLQLTNALQPLKKLIMQHATS